MTALYLTTTQYKDFIKQLQTIQTEAGEPLPKLNYIHYQGVLETFALSTPATAQELFQQVITFGAHPYFAVQAAERAGLVSAKGALTALFNKVEPPYLTTAEYKAFIKQLDKVQVAARLPLQSLPDDLLGNEKMLDAFACIVPKNREELDIQIQRLGANLFCCVNAAANDSLKSHFIAQLAAALERDAASATKGATNSVDKGARLLVFAKTIQGPLLSIIDKAALLKASSEDVKELIKHMNGNHAHCYSS